MKTALVTGATGFIGSHLISKLVKDGWRVRAVVRNPLRLAWLRNESAVETVVVRNIHTYTEWDRALDGVDVVVHLAGLAHDTETGDTWTPDDYRRVNTEATERLARCAAMAGVRRFVYISTTKVCGERTPVDRPFDEAATPDPQNPYSVSKHQAERALRLVADETGLDAVIIRPPLVYGPGMKGNMAKLAAMVMRRRLLPAPATGNRRSFIYVGSLVDAIRLTMDRPEAAGETFHVCDGEDLSTAELMRRMVKASGRRIAIIPVAGSIVAAVGRLGDRLGAIPFVPRLFGADSAEKLQNSLRVDASKIRDALGWRPPYSLDDGLRDTMQSCRTAAPRIRLLNIYDLFAAPLAWFAALAAGAASTMASSRDMWLSVFIVTGVQLLINGLMKSGSSRSLVSLADIARVSFLGALGIIAGLFMAQLLDSVPRLTILLYPLILAALLYSARLYRKAPRPPKKTEPHLAPFAPASHAAPRPVRESVGPAPLSTPGAPLRAQDAEPAVSVIIVNFNAATTLTECVRAALMSNIPVEVIVIDNGSTDGSVEQVREQLRTDSRLRIVENKKNLGFAKANNIALRYARGAYILLLNPDCIIEQDTIQRTVAYMQAQTDTGMAGCLIRNPDGSEQAGCRRLIPTPWRAFVRVTHLNKLLPHNPSFNSFILVNQPLPDRPVDIEALSGAFMFVRREALEQVGALDENYFMHCEDLDWCMRFRQAGWKIRFLPDVEIVHIRGVSSSHRPLKVLWHKHAGMVRFYRKFFVQQYPLPLMWLVFFSVWVRFALLSANAMIARPTAPSGDTHST